MKEEHLNKRLHASYILDNGTTMDLHNHTVWSDGDNTVLEIIENAIQNNIEVIGISDHLVTYPNRTIDLDLYIEELLYLKAKFKDKIHVITGVEINPFPFSETLANIDYDKINKLDYVLIENLENTSNLVHLEELHSYLCKIKSLVGLAHTDLIKLSYIFGSLDRVCAYISKNKMFWELNSSSEYAFYDDILYNNDNRILQMLIQYKIPITVGSDTHSLEGYEYGRLLQANKVARSFKYFSHSQ